jgi:hypothetical protein
VSGKKRLLVILVCVIIAVVVTILWTSSLKSSQPKLTEVVTVTKPVLRGYPFIQDQLTTIKIDSTTVSKDMVIKKEDLLNKFATRDVDPNIPVLSPYAGDSFAIRDLSEGMVPVRIPVDARSQGGVIPGDRANIIVTHPANKDTGAGSYSEILALNVKVLNLLYDTGSVEDQKSVKQNTIEGKDPINGGGGSSSAIVQKIDGLNGKYPTLVTMEVTPDVSIKVQNLVSDKDTFAIELDPWRYDQIMSLKDILDKKISTMIKFYDSGAKPLADFQSEYSKVTDLKKELTAQNGGIGYEKDFYLKLVRSQIAILEKVPASDQPSKDFVIKDLNSLAQELSNLNSGWWKIEDEVAGIRKYIDGLGGKLEIKTFETPVVTPAATPAVQPTTTPVPNQSGGTQTSTTNNTNTTSTKTSTKKNNNNDGVLIIQ